jgi:small subunit ribosomal protein S9
MLSTLGRRLFAKNVSHSYGVVGHSPFTAGFPTLAQLTTADELIEVEKNIVQMELREREVDHLGRSYATGRRKSAVARVWVKPGTGKIIINNRNFIEYFSAFHQRAEVVNVFTITARAGAYDTWCTVKGGGISGQSGAISLGISRALEKQEPTLRPLLRGNGLLTRDSRRVERKKPGQAKARKKFQWVKR